MSRPAIAAVLARDDLSVGERLVAFSLASFADRDGRARPGTPAAAGRAGLKRSWFLEARALLERRGLVVAEDAATGRGRASTLWLPFADAGPWWDGEINAELFEAVLSYSRAQGTVRLLLAAMAALADERRVVEGVTTSQLCAAAGFSDRTYRRAQAALLASGELVLRRGTGGRGNTNCWEMSDPRSGARDVKPVARQRVAPPPGQRPLLASVFSTPAIAAEERDGTGGDRVGEDLPVGGGKGGHERIVSGQELPVTAGVSLGKGGGKRTLSAANRPAAAGVSRLKGGSERTHFPETPAQTPAETPAPNARAGREPQNPRTVDPPGPPEGGSGADQVFVEETYLTERGRRRRRRVPVDLTAVPERLAAAGTADRAVWEQVRALLLETAGESTFEIWLAGLELIAVDRDGRLVIGTPEATRGWVQTRFGRLLERCAAQADRAVRFAAEHERLALEQRPGDAPPPAPHRNEGCSQLTDAPTGLTTQRMALISPARASCTSADRSASGSLGSAPDKSDDWQAGRASGGPPYRSAYGPSYTRVYTARREVS